MPQVTASQTQQADFWSNNPCGAEGSLLNKVKQRYRMEPWIPVEIETFPTQNIHYLEVGCGQGVDAFNICSRLDPSCRYTAIDYSTESVKRSIESIEEAKGLFGLKVIPEFRQGDALNLPFEDNSFDYVYSLGVIHHTPDPAKGIREVLRVLKPGGRCTIVLYRKWSLKVGVAKLLRAFQAGVDAITGKERSIYKILAAHPVWTDFLGTMLLECFGVPWMYWYTPDELSTMFAGFSKIDIRPYGTNLHLSGRRKPGFNRFGYFYRIEAIK